MTTTLGSVTALATSRRAGTQSVTRALGERLEPWDARSASGVEEPVELVGDARAPERVEEERGRVTPSQPLGHQR